MPRFIYNFNIWTVFNADTSTIIGQNFMAKVWTPPNEETSDIFRLDSVKVCIELNAETSDILLQWFIFNFRRCFNDAISCRPLLSMPLQSKNNSDVTFF